jgi:hypothetical protein
MVPMVSVSFAGRRSNALALNTPPPAAASSPAGHSSFGFDGGGGGGASMAASGPCNSPGPRASTATASTLKAP